MTITANLIHDPKRLVFALVPERGPVSLMLRVATPTGAYDAIRQIRPALQELRGDRNGMPVLLSIAECALADLGEDRLVGLLVKALTMAGLTCVGFVSGSPSSQALADASDLMVMPTAPGCSQVDLLVLAQKADTQALLAQEAKDWDEALVINAQMDIEIEAQAWDAALIEDQAFEARKEAARLEALRLAKEEAEAWDEAVVEDAMFERKQEAAAWEQAIEENARIDASHELLAWEEALAEEARRQAAAERARQELLLRMEQEAQAWEEAVAHNAALDAKELADAWEEALAEEALRTRAEQAAREAREAVLLGKPVSVPVMANVGLIAPASPRGAPVADLLADDHAEGDAGVATLAPPTISAVADVVVVPSAHIHRDRVRSGCQVYAKGTDLMVFGNVSSGAEIIADGSINAYAPVYGRIIAGAKRNKQAHVVCQHFFAEIVSIGGGFVTSDELPEDLRGTAVHFWHEDDGIHFRRLPSVAIPAIPL